MRTSKWILALLSVVAPIAHAQADPASTSTDAALVPDPIRVASLSGPADAEIRQTNRASISASYMRLPLSFERNQGQTDSRVKFLARGNGYTLFLTPIEAVLALRKADKSSSAPRSGVGLPSGRSAPIDRASMVPQKVETTVLRMKLVGANPEPLIEGRDELPGKNNYFIGKDPEKWRTGVSRYRRVRYADVYPGIDLVYYGNQQQLEYDFVVGPGVDPGAIRLSFEGADKLRIDDAGNLVITVSGGEVVQHVPLVYQETENRRHRVPGRYVLEGEGRVGFQLAAYDKGKPLVIDPVLSYSTYLGGSGDDEGVDIAVDSQGHIYVVGKTASTYFPTKGAYEENDLGIDVFVSKLDPTSSGEDSLVYSTYLGGTKTEPADHWYHGPAVSVDQEGNAYVTGTTNSLDFPTTLSAYQERYPHYDSSDSYPAMFAAFVTKLNPSGSSLIYSTFLGAYGWTEGGDITVDSGGYAYVTGSTRTIGFPTSENAYKMDCSVPPSSGYYSFDVFVTKLNPSGTGYEYSTCLGESLDDFSFGISVDNDGNAYVTGQTNSLEFPTTPNAYQGNNSNTAGVPDFMNEDGCLATWSCRDIFVTKINASGTDLLYSTYLGGWTDEYGNGIDRGDGIAVDSEGYVYVGGTTSSPGFPTKGAYQENGSGLSDAFVAKFDPTSSGDDSLVYSTLFGGRGWDSAWDIAIDSFGNVYITGLIASGGTGSTLLTSPSRIPSHATVATIMLPTWPSSIRALALRACATQLHWVRCR